MRLTYLRWPLAGLLALLAAGCGGLPDYARPRMVHPSEDERQYPGIPFRVLTREDFRAAAPPEASVEHARRANAITVTEIRPSPLMQTVIVPSTLFGQAYFFGHVQHPGFHAVMIPERSWWNPGMSSAVADYALQHERIHFAITELAARKLTRDARAWAADLLIIRSDPQEVAAEITRQLREIFAAARVAEMKRHTDFDEDTSGIYSPRRQAWWAHEVEDELRQTGRGDPPDAAQ